LFAGHIVVYRIVAPDARQAAAPGVSHAYLPIALTVGLLVAVLAGARAFLLGYRRGTAPDSCRRHPGLIGTLVLPAVAQAAAFVALEVLERALAGAPIGGLVGPLLSVGVVLQLVVGAAGGLLLAGLDRAGELTGRAVAARRRHPGRETESNPWPLATPGPFASPRRSLAIRGPPVGSLRH
jgi:hypothetical protein